MLINNPDSLDERWRMLESKRIYHGSLPPLPVRTNDDKKACSLKPAIPKGNVLA